VTIRRDHSPDDDDEGRGDATASRRRGDCVVDAQRPTRARSPSPASAATSVRVMSWFPCCLRTRHTEGSNMPPGGSRTTGLLANGPLLQAHDCDEQCYLHHSLNVPNICAFGVWTNPSNGARWQLDLGPTAARRNWLIAKRWLSSVRSCDYNAYFFTRLAPWLVGLWLSGLARPPRADCRVAQRTTSGFILY
jgi:hypothetical protein